MAVLLSFLCPGLGHLYLGRLFQGLLFFVLTIAGYIAFVVPGLLIHLFVLVDANREANRQKKSEMVMQARMMAEAVHGKHR